MLKVQVDYWALQEQKRHNLATEKQQDKSIFETVRHNVATENVSYFDAFERKRSNLANEAIRRTQAQAAVEQANAAKRQAQASLITARANQSNAETNRINAGINQQNANSNSLQAQVAARNATVNEQQLKVNQLVGGSQAIANTTRAFGDLVQLPYAVEGNRLSNEYGALRTNQVRSNLSKIRKAR